jgi:DHA2 family multidrug resistance protein
VSNAIVLPISGWLALRVGRKRFYMTCVALFAVSSLFCGLAPSLGLLVFFRVLQGAGGGGLAPSEQAILADTFAPSQRGMAFAVYGMAVVVAPALGPTLGGLLTDSVGWRWIFFLNVPVGAVSLLLTRRLLVDPPYIREQNERGRVRVDVVGLVLVVLGFGALQVVLDKGQEEDWFGSNLIRGFFAIAAVSLIALVLREVRVPHPVVDVKLLRSRNLGLGCLLIFLVGVILFGSSVLLPQYEQVLLGYAAQKAGETLSIGALVIVPLMPVVGWLLKHVAARWLVAFGFALSALALHVMGNLYLGVNYGTLVGWRTMQGLGLAFLFIPITTGMYIGLPPEKNEEGAALLNLARNLGGSIGIAFIESLVARRSQIHQSVLVAHTTRFNPAFQAALVRAQAVAGGAARSTRAAYASVYAQVQRQAAALAYADVLRMLAVLAALATVAALFLRSRPPAPASR